MSKSKEPELDKIIETLKEQATYLGIENRLLKLKLLSLLALLSKLK